MKKIVNKYYYLESEYHISQESKRLKLDYDGHLTVKITWGGFGAKGSNPIQDKQMSKVASELDKHYKQINLDTFMNKSITVLYIKRNERRKVFKHIASLVEKEFNKH